MTSIALSGKNLSFMYLLESFAAAIIASLVGPSVISLIISLLDGNLKLGVGRYWIINASDTFIENPILSNLWFPLIVYGAYIVISIFLGTTLLKNKEIK